MLLLLHIIIALTSLAAASAAFIAPSLTTLRASYSFIGLTLVSGIALVVSSPATLLHVCLSGVLYVSLATIAVVATHRKLAQAR